MEQTLHSNKELLLSTSCWEREIKYLFLGPFFLPWKLFLESIWGHTGQIHPHTFLSQYDTVFFFLSFLCFKKYKKEGKKGQNLAGVLIAYQWCIVVFGTSETGDCRREPSNWCRNWGNILCTEILQSSAQMPERFQRKHVSSKNAGKGEKKSDIKHSRETSSEISNWKLK